MLFVLRGGNFPASGFRTRETGLFREAGGEGDSWGSSSRGIGAVGGNYLRFLENSVGPCHDYSRVYGFPVRCVQAFIFIV